MEGNEGLVRTLAILTISAVAVVTFIFDVVLVAVITFTVAAKLALALAQIPGQMAVLTDGRGSESGPGCHDGLGHSRGRCGGRLCVESTRGCGVGWEIGAEVSEEGGVHHDHYHGHRHAHGRVQSRSARKQKEECEPTARQSADRQC